MLDTDYLQKRNDIALSPRGLVQINNKDLPTVYIKQKPVDSAVLQQYGHLPEGGGDEPDDFF